ncbi:MAG: phenylalanine--tRNA ligase subunit beta, partial [Candidatus Gracilibacteria bacterium]
LVIADSKKPVAVAGIMGGEFSGINENTTSIILESANFNAGSIRKTAVKLGLRTDSSARFEKALDPQLAMLAILHAAELILKICPSAKISGPITDVKNFDEDLRKIILNTEKTTSKIGIDIKEKDIKKILTSLEFEVKKHDKNSLEITVPSFRGTKDVTIEDDLIEEVARIYGYDNIPAILPALPARLPIENTERFKKHRARELFSYALGFDEVYNYSFYSINDLKKCLMKEEGHIKLLNFLSEDQTHLRTSLVPNLLKNICLNIKYFDEFKIYEIGRTYKEIGQFYPLEEKFIGGAIVKKGKTDEVFYTAKGAVESFFEKFSIKNIKTTADISAPYAHPVKCATFLDETGQTLAKIFMLHSIVSNNFDLDKYSIAFFEINFTESLKKHIQEKKYQQLPRFPKIEIDISVLLNKETTIEKIKESILSSDNSIIKTVELFDIYEGDKIEAGKKAVAFRITLQAEDRTLTDDEMSKIQLKIFKNLEGLGGIIRGK